MEKKLPYRYCIVPMCTNTTITTPKKYFFHVPNDKKVRNKWCKLMKRKDLLKSTKTSRHCCEDHFNIELDTENHMKWRFCGGTLKLKQGIVPTKFECQKRKSKCTVTHSEDEKIEKSELYEKQLTTDVPLSINEQSCLPEISIPLNDSFMNVDEATNLLPIDNITNTELLVPNINETKEECMQEQQKEYVQTQTSTDITLTSFILYGSGYTINLQISDP